MGHDPEVPVEAKRSRCPETSSTTPGAISGVRRPRRSGITWWRRATS